MSSVGNFFDLLADMAAAVNPPKIADGEVVIRFYSGVRFSFPVGTQIENARSFNKATGLHFKGADFNFTVRPKPALDFNI